MARLSGEDRQKILADREGMTIRQLAEKYGVSPTTVHRVLHAPGAGGAGGAQPPEDGGQDVLAYLDGKRAVVCQIIGKGLDVLNSEEKLAQATPAQITTALNALLEKFLGRLPEQKAAPEESMSLSDKLEVIRKAAQRYGH